jgi:hypothetical protein
MFLLPRLRNFRRIHKAYKLGRRIILLGELVQ